MHIIGLANGTPFGNSEILLKAALTAATESDSTITTS
jgi:multimeric flavodoxin WrbA